MSKRDKALQEIYNIENMANNNQWMNRIHPLVKLVVTFTYIVLLISIPKYNLATAMTMGIYPIAIFILGEVPIRESVRKLKVVIPLVCLVGLFNPFFDKEILFTIGTVPVTAGILSMLTLFVKGICAVLASYLLVATTTIEKICYSLSILHIPTIIITQVLLMYRYITVLLLESKRMTQAYSLRAPRQKGIYIGAWGSFVGRLLLRSIDRGKLVYESMILRGYKGEFHYDIEKCKGKDYLYLVVWLLILIMIRLVKR